MQSPDPINRRQFMATPGAAAFATQFGPVSAHDAPATAHDVICQENSKPGAFDWQVTRVRVDAKNFRSPWIEDYCSRQSVLAGESVEIMVSAKPARNFRLEIFRLGYYGGRGARKLQELGPFDAQTQPTPEPGEKNLHECRWKRMTTLTIPADWPSGLYIGRMTTIPEAADEAYWQSYVTFIVRDERPADILFQCSDNTWQAYNRWPNDFSLYTHPKGLSGPSADVSFDRPYGRESQYILTSGPRPAVVALEPSARPRRKRAADYSQPA